MEPLIGKSNDENDKKGPCVQCGQLTDKSMTLGGITAFLCPQCRQHAADMNITDEDEISPIEQIESTLDDIKDNLDDFTHKFVPTSYEELLQHGKKTDEILSKISCQSKTVEVLRKYGKSPADFKDIFYDLLRSGCGEYVTQSVIKNPQLLSEYLQMKADGISDVEIAYKLSESLGGP